MPRQRLVIRLIEHGEAYVDVCAKCGGPTSTGEGSAGLFLIPRGRPVCTPCGLAIDPEIAQLEYLYWAAIGFAQGLGENPAGELAQAAGLFRSDAAAKPDAGAAIRARANHLRLVPPPRSDNDDKSAA